ncbi:hypothetical protein DIPPA_19455 [Diplonema papillatum]|nr:hypothetical protein DIPPA_19455 [Diplonema papillatum]
MEVFFCPGGGGAAARGWSCAPAATAGVCRFGVDSSRDMRRRWLEPSGGGVGGEGGVSASGCGCCSGGVVLTPTDRYATAAGRQRSGLGRVVSPALAGRLAARGATPLRDECARAASSAAGASSATCGGCPVLVRKLFSSTGTGGGSATGCRSQNSSKVAGFFSPPDDFSPPASLFPPASPLPLSAPSPPSQLPLPSPLAEVDRSFPLEARAGRREDDRRCHQPPPAACARAGGWPSAGAPAPRGGAARGRSQPTSSSRSIHSRCSRAASESDPALPLDSDEVGDPAAGPGCCCCCCCCCRPVAGAPSCFKYSATAAACGRALVAGSSVLLSRRRCNLQAFLCADSTRDTSSVAAAAELEGVSAAPGRLEEARRSAARSARMRASLASRSRATTSARLPSSPGTPRAISASPSAAPPGSCCSPGSAAAAARDRALTANQGHRSCPTSTSPAAPGTRLPSPAVAAAASRWPVISGIPLLSAAAAARCPASSGWGAAAAGVCPAGLFVVPCETGPPAAAAAASAASRPRPAAPTAPRCPASSGETSAQAAPDLRPAEPRPAAGCGSGSAVPLRGCSGDEFKKGGAASSPASRVPAGVEEADPSVPSPRSGRGRSARSPPAAACPDGAPEPRGWGPGDSAADCRSPSAAFEPRRRGWSRGPLSPARTRTDGPQTPRGWRPDDSCRTD